MVGQVILGIIAVLAGCLATTSAVVAARHTGNWLFFICALGATAFVAGVVGQRVFPSPDAVARFGQSSASVSIPGPWDAGVLLPIVGIRVTPVAIGGLLVAAVGLSLVRPLRARPWNRACAGGLHGRRGLKTKIRSKAGLTTMPPAPS